MKEEVDNVKGKLVGIMHGMGADGAGGRKTWGTSEGEPACLKSCPISPAYEC